MDVTIEIDLNQAARELSLSLENVGSTVALLDDGNTVPFITRYRKDQTGALDEEQIRRIQEKVGKLRALVERKQTILKSIHAQGKLTSELETQIRGANSPKRLEDLYLPYKPKKQSLATVARQRGLEPLAREILEAESSTADLRQRAESFIAPEKELDSVDAVLTGAGHIIAESFSERADVRGRLRKILQKSGKILCSRIEAGARRETAPESDPAATPEASPSMADADADGSSSAAAIETEPESSAKSTVAPSGDSAVVPREAPVVTQQSSDAADGTSTDPSKEDVPAPAPQADLDASSTSAESGEAVEGRTDLGDAVQEAALAEPTDGCEPVAPNDPATLENPDPTGESIDGASGAPSAPQTEEGGSAPSSGAAAAEGDSPAAGPMPTDPSVAAPAEPTPVEPAPVEPAPVEPAQGTASAAAKPSTKKTTGKHGPLSAAMSKKEKKRQRLAAAFKDYYDFQESISRLPSHRILAINRGEKAKILRVKLDADLEAMAADADSLLISDGHPHAEFLRACVRDALCRLLIPSLERELRREMTEKAEEHAVEVFARNLRKLLLQPPVHNRRVLAIDPGFRSGCKLIALDDIGNVLGHEIIHVIGKEEWIRSGRAKMIRLIKKHNLSVVAIGNGAACRETEQLVVEVMANELNDEDVAFVIVNEAGASVYSTSPLGREELPTFDAVLRSAISIGRRLLDPLSELVKINPANIGVGMYQHDVKAKHLRNSLDAVVESCVNYVGVDVNTASASLLRYVSGLNQLTARRLCEYRSEHGPFTNREQFKQVPGLGEATYVQAVGFLKIVNGDNPLDATWIHPESYDLACSVLETMGCGVADLSAGPPMTDAGKPAESPLEVERPTAEAPAERAVESTSAADPAKPTESGGPLRPEIRAELPFYAEECLPPAATGRDGAPTTVSADHQVTVDSVEPTASSVAVPSDVAEIGHQTAVCDKVSQLNIAALSEALSVSKLLLRDIVNSLARPGRDPREDLPAPVFRRGIVKLEDLEPGMKLSGTVLNVVDFGAFVDIGLSDSGLIHISRLADRFIRDPHEVVGVGDVLTVWVVEIDKQRRRVSLTAIEPGTERTAQQRRESGRQKSRKPSAGRPPRRKPKADHETRPRPAGRGSHSKSRQRTRPPRKPKVVTPITKEMEEGKEPLRSFSDLMQFYEKKKTDEDEPKS